MQARSRQEICAHAIHISILPDRVSDDGIIKMTDGTDYRQADEIIEDLVHHSESMGNFSYSALIEFVEKENFWGVATGSQRDRKYYILFCGGEPKGALVKDRNGTLAGDRAILTLRGTDDYELFSISPPVVDQLVLGCRIFDTSHLKKNRSLDIPELGKRSEGVGIFTMIVRKDASPQQGLKIIIRKGGQILGNDFTNHEGKVRFKLKTGRYEIVVTRKNGEISYYEVLFDSASLKGPSVLNI